MRPQMPLPKPDENQPITNCPQAAFECAVGMVSVGASIPASISLELLDWAEEKGDKDVAAFLEEELTASGKAHYLAALNSPSC